MELPQATVESYRRDGFVVARGLLAPDDAARYRAAALAALPSWQAFTDAPVLLQFVNVWRHDPVMRELTLLPRLAAWATQLAGVPLRLWHDQLLIKQPRNGAATEFHQDQPYWPHTDSPNALSCWIALCDVPVEKGCMSFIAGSHTRTGLPPQDLVDPQSLFRLSPGLAYEPRTTIPLRAGDCTFHHGCCAHMAGANNTDEIRIAHAVILMDAGTRYVAKRHPVTDTLGLARGEPLAGDLFPAVG